jgi:predicted phage tail protein
MRQTVRLLDDLGERYGSEHVYYDLQTPADAIKLLCINKPDFQKELTYAHKHGIEYTLVQADYFLDYKDLHLPLGKNDLILAPVVAGSGGGIGKTILGVGLVAAAVILAPVTGSASLGFLGAAGTGFLTAGASIAIGSIGTGLILGGIAQMISPQPEVPTFGGTGERGRTSPGQTSGATGPQGVSRATSGVQSYAFQGPANTIGVGATIPLVYGKMLVGSHLLSAKIQVSDESDPSSDYFTIPGQSSITVNGEDVENKFHSNAGLRTRKWTQSQLYYKNVGSEGNYNRRIRNEVVSIEDGSTDSATIFGYNSSNKKRKRQNFQVFLEIDRGLFNKASDQIVPSFVTYEMKLIKDKLDGSDAEPVVAKVQGTIQGLLRKTDKYKWCHSISYGVVGLEDSDTVVKLVFSIIDTDADSSNRLVLRAAGYEFFRKKSENRTEALDQDADD